MSTPWLRLPRARRGTADRAPRGEGRGRVLAAAFDEAERQPALQEGREQALELVNRGAPAARGRRPWSRPTSASPARSSAPPASSRAAAACAASPTASSGSARARWRRFSAPRPAYDIFNGDGRLALAPDRFRLHALAVQRAADRIAEMSGIGDRDELALAAILHDIGRPVLARLHPGYAERFDRRGATPDDRIAEERRELGIDHALVGGVLTRRWGVHARIAEAIERHHTREAEGMGAVIRVADMVAAHIEDCPGQHPGPGRGRRCTAALTSRRCRMVLYELPQGKGATSPRQRPVPALLPRAGRPPAPRRGQGLQADRR